jgi:hypothetical protein
MYETLYGYVLLFITTYHMNTKKLLMNIAPLLVIGAGITYAAAPLGGYLPGSTTDPDCAPGEADCFVQLPVETPNKFVDGTTATDAVFTGGNVGIGTTSPGGKLHVFDTAPTVRITEAGIAGVDLEVLDGNFNIGNASGDTFVSTDLVSGNVGIGTTSPSARLHVNEGEVRIDRIANDTTQKGAVIFTRGDTTGNKMSIRTTGDGANGVQGIKIGQNNNTSADLFVDITGNVGIGTTSPKEKLHISSTGTGIVNSALFGNANGGNDGDGARISLSGSNSSARAAYIEGVNVEGAGTGNEHALAFGTNVSTSAPVERMRIDYNGNVGIGTTSPSQKLHVAGSIQTGLNTGGVALTNNDGGGNANITFNHTNRTPDQDGNAGRITVNTDETTDAGMFFQVFENVTAGTVVGSSSLMVLQGNGNVGIGTTSPISKLHIQQSVNDSETSGLTLSDTGGSTNFIISVKDNSTTYLGARASFPTSNGINIHHGSGRVGIGTNAPSQKLHVNGSALATAWNTTSDKRLKENFVNIGKATEKVSKLNGVYFDWKKTGEHDLGVIAQEVEEIFPEIVTTDEDGWKSVDYSKLTPVLIEAVKELSAQNTDLEKQNAQMQDDIDMLKAALNIQ